MECSGDLIQLAKEGAFNVIAHGCNCFCKMRKGIAVEMDKVFQCSIFPFEAYSYKGDINKLGCIDYKRFCIADPHNNGNKLAYEMNASSVLHNMKVPYNTLTVVNCYTQYHWANVNNSHPFDIVAFRLCMRKINTKFTGNTIGLPKIGAGLAGGDWEEIKQVIKEELTNCDVVIVIKE